MTRRLIDILNDAKGAPRAVASIYGQMHRESQVPGKWMDSPPVHVREPDKDTIVLQQLGKISRSRKEMLAQTMAGQNVPGYDKDLRVKLSITLTDNTAIPLLDEFKNWLTTNLLSNVDEIKVKVTAYFDSPYSSSIEFTLPIEIWTMMDARDMSFKFHEFVVGTNLLLPREPESRTLAERPGPDANTMGRGGQGRGTGGPLKG